MADTERIRKRNNIILGVGMIILLVGSSLGYSLMSADGDNKNAVSENGFDFIQENGLWKLTVDVSQNGQDSRAFGFQHLPSEVSDIDVNISARLETYSGQPIYFVNPGEGVSEILGNIGSYILRYQEACLVNSSDSCNGDLPVKDCNSNLIIFEQGNDTRVYEKDSCVFIVGDSSLGSDAFLYEVLGI